MFPFHNPCKHQKTKGFLVFSGRSEMDTFTRNGLKSSREIENIVNAVMQGSG